LTEYIYLTFAKHVNKLILNQY